jgi:hypothetical protein
VLAEANDTVTQIILRATAELKDHRAKGGNDAEFAENLMKTFHQEAMVSPLGAGSRHMALSVYRMVWQQEMIRELSEKVAMRDAALEMLFELQEM